MDQVAAAETAALMPAERLQLLPFKDSPAEITFLFIAAAAADRDRSELTPLIRAPAETAERVKLLDSIR